MKDQIKITYKIHPRRTGLLLIVCPRQFIDCKINKQTFGNINLYDDGKWRILLSVARTPTPGNPCTWEWIKFIKTFDTSEHAKKWLNDNIKVLINRYVLVQAEKSSIIKL